MTTLVSAVATVFTPATGTFNVQCVGGDVRIERRNTSGAGWATVGFLASGEAKVVDNPVALADYRFTTLSGTPTVQADQ